MGDEKNLYPGGCKFIFLINLIDFFQVYTYKLL